MAQWHKLTSACMALQACFVARMHRCGELGHLLCCAHRCREFCHTSLCCISPRSPYTGCPLPTSAHSQKVSLHNEHVVLCQLHQQRDHCRHPYLRPALLDGGQCGGQCESRWLLCVGVLYGFVSHHCLARHGRCATQLDVAARTYFVLRICRPFQERPFKKKQIWCYCC